MEILHEFLGINERQFSVKKSLYRTFFPTEHFLVFELKKSGAVSGSKKSLGPVSHSQKSLDPDPYSVNMNFHCDWEMRNAYRYATTGRT
jgi:hypothetical protein